MTPFQIIAIAVLGLLLLRDALGFCREAGPQLLRGLRAFVWLAAGVAIALPELVQGVAESVGIGRAADLVFYLFVLAFIGVSFYFYSRFVRMQRQVTQLVRHLAIEHAQRGGQHALHS